MDQQLFLRLATPAYELAQGIQKMQNFRQRYWLKIFLADKVGREFQALVFEQNDRRLRVCVTDYMLETEIFLPRSEAGKSGNFRGGRLPVRLAALPQESEAPLKFELARWPLN